MERIPAELEKLAERLPAMVIEALRDQVARIAVLDTDIAGIEGKLVLWKKEDKAANILMSIPGVGLLTATAVVATIGDATAFKNGREFAAFIGLVPRQSGTGGRVKLLGISKRGDVYPRTLLIHGARVVVTHGKQREPWLEKLLARRPLNVAVVAVANKMARTIWALLSHDRIYQRGYAARAA
jgi:transposase